MIVRYDVSGFPTIKFFPAGSSEAENYELGRDLESFVNYINEKVGTQRTVEGGLLPTAGRIDELDAMISAAESIDATLLEKFQATIEGMKGPTAVFALTYVQVASKIVQQGVAYIEKETQRLQKMLSSVSIKPESKSNFMIKKNILQAFVRA